MTKALEIMRAAAYASVTLMCLALAAIFVQVALQVHRVPLLLLKAEATVDAAGRTAQNLDKASAAWESTSKAEGAFLQGELPRLTTRLEQNLETSNQLLANVDTTTRRLGDTADSVGARTASTLGALDATLADVDAGVKPVLFNSAMTLQSANTLLADPAIKQSLTNIQALTLKSADAVDQADGILADGRKVADKETTDFLKPVPWYLWPIKRSGEILDVGAAIARHTP